MPIVAVSILRFVDEHQPGFVGCELTDAFGQTHSFVEKLPIVTVEGLWSGRTYPCTGGIACEVEQEWQDDAGRSLVKVNTERPWSVESTTGGTTFVVHSSQIAKANSLAWTGRTTRNRTLATGGLWPWRTARGIQSYRLKL